MYSVARIPDGRIRILGQDANQQQVNVYLNPLDALELSIVLGDEAKRVLAHSHESDHDHPGWTRSGGDESERDAYLHRTGPWAWLMTGADHD